ncbi:PilN domain-containing protein [Acidobacteriota bacterium]
MIRINLLKSDQAPPPKGAEAAPPPASPEQVYVPEEGKEKKKLSLEFNYNLIFLLVIVAIAALFYTQKTSLDKERELLLNAENEKSTLSDVVKTLDQLEQQRTTHEAKINLITELKSRQGAAVFILDELSRNIPEWVWLTEASYRGNTVRLKGRAINNNLVAQYISNLEESPYFSNIELNNTTQKTSGSNTYYEFNLSSQYTLPLQAKPDDGQNTEEQK